MALGSSLLIPRVVVGVVCVLVQYGTSVAAESQILSTTEAPSNKTCSSKVFVQVQNCLKKAGVMSAPLLSVANPKFTPAFCGSPENATMNCLQANLDVCADNPPRLALLKLQVDPQRSHGNLQYVCQQRHVLQTETNCTRLQVVSTCIRRAKGKIRESLALGASEFKPVLDTQCLYNNILLQCLTGSLDEDGCNGTRQFYEHLTQAMRFPYCDLSQLEQHTRLHHALSLREKGDKHDDHDNENADSGSPQNDTTHGSHGHQPPHGSGSSKVVCSDSLFLGHGIALMTVMMYAGGFSG